MFDITFIIEAVFALIGLCITTFLIPYIRSKTTTAQQNEINTWIRIAVSAAEQVIEGSGRGQEKKQYVIEWLNNRNIKYDSSKIDAMIEAAVYELNKNGLIRVAADEVKID